MTPNTVKALNKSLVLSIPYNEVNLRLSADAVVFLSGITGGVSHMSVFAYLVANMAVESATFIKRGIEITLNTSEVEASANSLAEVFGLGRKPMTRILDNFSKFGILDLRTSKLASIARLVSVSPVGPDGVKGEEGPTPSTITTDSSETTESVMPPASGSILENGIPHSIQGSLFDFSDSDSDDETSSQRQSQRAASDTVMTDSIDL